MEQDGGKAGPARRVQHTVSHVVVRVLALGSLASLAFEGIDPPYFHLIGHGWLGGAIVA